MTQREPESLFDTDTDTDTDNDTHAFLFGDSDQHPQSPVETTGSLPVSDGPTGLTGPRTRRHAASPNRRRRGGRLFFFLAAAIVVVVVVAAALVYPKLRNHFSTPDYSGAGSGSVSVVVGQGNSATTIAGTLKARGVVKSTKAFVKAANADPDSQNIQAGTYVLHKHMSGKLALAMLLDPSTRSAASDLVITEGETSLDVESKLVTAMGAAAKVHIDQVLKDVADAGVPIDYSTNGSASGVPTSIEGFLYPATYNVGTTDSPLTVIQKMTGAFIAQDRASGFALDAAQLKITPYQALIIASIAQSEAKFPADMAKVARVILNRIAARQPLQIDATSAYGAKLQGLDPTKVTYANLDSPYNSYTHSGLPPTPISNPGADAMNAAVHPTSGNWLYYVNADAAGHLFFTNSMDAFNAAAQKCRKNNWGCG